jgi:uncharacterized membrane protein YjjB (DUF3815 family)
MWRQALIANEINPVAAAYVGSMVVGLLGYSQARFFHMPRLIFTVTGIISMVPGIPAFETIVFFIREDIEAGLESFIRAGLIVGAIAFGLVTARLLATLGDTAINPPTRGSWQREIGHPQATNAHEE